MIGSIRSFYEGVPIYIATTEYQRRKHHKRRINKKWRKRYGSTEFNYIPHGQIVVINDALWMTKKTYREFLKKVGVAK